MLSVRRATRDAGEGRWYEHGPQPGPLHTRQWIGTYGNRGNGDYQEELALALQAIKTYLAHFALTTETALVRLDGQYGDAVVIAQRDTRQGSISSPEDERIGCWNAPRSSECSLIRQTHM